MYEFCYVFSMCHNFSAQLHNGSSFAAIQDCDLWTTSVVLLSDLQFYLRSFKIFTFLITGYRELLIEIKLFLVDVATLKK